MSLIQEAIDDARQLREAAEEVAKQKIIEALAPRVKVLVEQQLEDEGTEGDEIDIDDIESAALEDIDFGAGAAGDFEYVPDVEPMADIGAGYEEPEPEVEIEQGAEVNVTAQGDVNIHLGETEDDDEEDDLLLDMPAGVREAARSVKMALQLVGAIESGDYTVAESKQLMRASDKLVDRMLKFNESRIFRGNSRATRRLLETIKELTRAQKLLERSAMSRKRRIYEMMETSHGDMDEMGSYDELDELDVALEITPEDDEEAEALEGLGVEDLDIDVMLAGAEEGEEDEEDMDMDFDFGDEEGGEEMEGDDEVIEVSEAALRREIKRLRRLREADGSPSDAAMRDFGGGDVGDEMFIDVDEETLLNVLADELGRADVKSPTVESRRRRRPRRRIREGRRSAARPASQGNRPARRSNPQAAQMRQALQEARKQNAKMKRNLQEMNLFNAKLLYVNKIMQNRNVTPKQQRAIVEALDNAKTLRECKLLYKTLTASLNKRGALTESRVRLMGSSSRSTPSAQPASNGVETDRWAVLAGINKDGAE